MWYYRLNGGPPAPIPFKWRNSNNIRWNSNNIVFEAKFKAKGAKEILVYYDNDPSYFSDGMKAYEMFEVKLKLPYFDPWSLGTIDVSQKTLSSKLPDLFSKCKDSADVTIEVKKVEAPLAYKSAGEDFERFMSQITDQWRSHVMEMVKEGMEKKKLDENKRIDSGEMYKVIACLHGHMKSIKATQEFDNCFKAIKK
eukprot:203563_1